jgi:hypothetical protein
MLLEILFLPLRKAGKQESRRRPTQEKNSYFSFPAFFRVISEKVRQGLCLFLVSWVP